MQSLTVGPCECGFVCVWSRSCFLVDFPAVFLIFVFRLNELNTSRGFLILKIKQRPAVKLIISENKQNLKKKKKISENFLQSIHSSPSTPFLKWGEGSNVNAVAK